MKGEKNEREQGGTLQEEEVLQEEKAEQAAASNCSSLHLQLVTVGARARGQLRRAGGIFMTITGMIVVGPVVQLAMGARGTKGLTSRNTSSRQAAYQALTGRRWARTLPFLVHGVEISWGRVCVLF